MHTQKTTRKRGGEDVFAAADGGAGVTKAVPPGPPTP